LSTWVVRRAAAALIAGAALLGTASGAAPGEPAAPSPGARLDFEVDDALNINRFVREGPVAGHLLLRSGAEPRILIAFPAGNSGVGLWFEKRSEEARWTLDAAPRPVHAADAHGRALYGLTADVSIAAPELAPHQAVLSSIRVLRDYQSIKAEPPEISVAPAIAGRTITWARDRLDGAAGYRLVLEVTHGELANGRISAAADGRIGLRVTGLTGEVPLTPLTGAELLSESAGADSAARNTLAFLAYREKLLAGSWRFDTYFGRDTLISLRLLMPALNAPAIEDALGSVLARLSPKGEVAHEEDIGEQAVLDHLKADGSRSAAPVYDYKMIDGDYLLAPVASAWLLHDARGRSRAAPFLAAAGSLGAAGPTRGAALVQNLRLVLANAAAFARDPSASKLITLKPGYSVGEWRDSEHGLGGGRYPYDVNAVLVPAALTAAAELYESGLLAPYLEKRDRASFAGARHLADVWRTRAPPLFDVVIPNEKAVGAVFSYAVRQKVAALPAIASLGPDDLRFHALALDAAGKAIPVVHSDEGFALLFSDLDAASVERAVVPLMRPFPAGLMTEVGLLVANPAFAAPELQEQLSRNAYHGTVVWSWQQALFAAGLARQLSRSDLPATVRAHLTEAQKALWTAIDATRAISNSELWSWSFGDRHYHVEAFGTAAADADESNAAQLWSTVYLAVRPPAEMEKTP
jgi:glycogen debranching enzyme